MPVCLVTCFDPFGGEKINPSRECVFSLPDQIGSLKIIKKEIPTVFGSAGSAAIRYARECGAKLVLLTGAAGGRAFVTPEAAALNLRDARIPDNAGGVPWDQPVVPGGPDGLFSTLPVHKMLEGVADLPIRLSYSAGTFVCNDAFYTVLHAFRGTDVRTGFVHVPYLTVQNKQDVPSLPQETVVRCLEAWLTQASLCCYSHTQTEAL